MEAKKQSWHAQAAGLIKKELQKRYPLIKFAVKSDRYSVTARYTDGPTAHDVEQVMNPYTNGTFDGMTDCFNYTKSAKPVSVNYVFAERDYSDKARDDMRAELAKKYGISKTGDEDDLPCRFYGLWTMGQFINHELHALDLYPKQAPQEDRHVACIISDILDDLAQPEKTQAQQALVLIKTDETMRTGIVAIIHQDGAATFKDGSRLTWQDIEAEEINSEDLEAAGAMLDKLTAEEKTA